MNNSLIVPCCRKIFNRLIAKARDFCSISCVPDGIIEIIKFYSCTGIIPEELKYTESFSFDFDYFAFAKSTKSLIAIRQLLNHSEFPLSEDSFMLIRSIFENHILSRFVRENIDDADKRKEVVDNFILAPLGISFDHYVSRGRKGVFSRDNIKVGEIQNPRGITVGKDAEYYDFLYPFLCQYTHCSYGASPCYFISSGFSYNKENHLILAYLLAIFAFTKLYEGVVTVNGEDLVNKKMAKSYYDLAYDSLEFQIQVMDFLVDYYKNLPKEKIDAVLEKYIGVEEVNNSNMRIANMLQKLKNSLFDSEIGSLNKSEFSEGHFVRKYQEW